MRNNFQKHRKSKALVPFVSLNLQYQEIKKAVQRDWEMIFSKGEYLSGETINSFEKSFAKFCQVKYAHLVASGTDALYLSLLACGIGKGDEVITPSFTFVSSALSIIRVGAKPIFVDIDPNNYLMDTVALEKKITKKTKAILPVHLFGQMANMNKIIKLAQKNKLLIIEDAAQAHGATLFRKPAGSLGDIACFSFYPTKNLSSFSDSGAIVTNNEKLLEHIKRLANYGFKKRYISEEIGFNSRSDTLQAAWLKVSLKLLPKWNKRRNFLAQRYNKLLSDLPIILPKVENGNYHVYHVYVIRVSKRDKLKKYLAAQGITTLIHYPIPIHLQGAFNFLPRVSLPNTELCSDEILSLPIFPQLTEKQQDYICSSIRKFFYD